MVQSSLLLKYKKIRHYFLDKKESSNLEKFPINFDRLIRLEQVHDSRVVRIKNTVQTYYKGYDGAITDREVILSIHTADCLPIFFWEKKLKLVAAIHAGWRGLLIGILPKLVKKMVKLGGRVDNIVAAIGPHISVCCYNVSYQRLWQFNKLQGTSGSIAEVRNNQWYLDLGKIASLQLLNCGLLKQNIDLLPICTSCNQSYYSFRREGKSCGRMINIIEII